ncbi:hypothetical protein K0M31_017902 [Melipona bicolor]|uniref:Uncharacterized protein n=1 Tax=Melipona bicolor TaxID=60889 RepID=A0AA40KSY7_9HYME|nr:hypothetical protein K0M31_017902 [Melipona bicolor]
MQEKTEDIPSTGILVRTSFEVPPPEDLSDAFFRPSSHNLATFALSLWPEPVDGRRKKFCKPALFNVLDVSE